MDRVLLVDREPNRCRLMRRKLQRHGLEVTSVASLEELATVADLPQRVMVIDLSMVCGSDTGCLEELVGRVLGTRAFECEVCGRSVVEMVPGDGELVCCGRAMRRAATAERPERDSGVGSSWSL